MREPAAAWGATIGALLGYVLATFNALPAFIYSPTVGRWSMGEIPGEPGIRWFGWVMWLMAGGLLGAVAGSALRSRPPWWIAWGLGTVALVGLAIEQRHWFVR